MLYNVLLVSATQQESVICIHGASLVAQTVKSLPVMQETRARPLGWKDPLEEDMATHSSTLPGKSHGQWSLVGYSPRGHKESDRSEQLTLSLFIRGTARSLISQEKHLMVTSSETASSDGQSHPQGCGRTDEPLRPQ